VSKTPFSTALQKNIFFAQESLLTVCAGFLQMHRRCLQKVKSLLPCLRRHWCAPLLVFVAPLLVFSPTTETARGSLHPQAFFLNT